MNRSLCAERLSELIGLIYDFVIEPQRWQPTVDALREGLDFATAALGLLALPGSEPLLMATPGIEPEWLAKLHGEGASVRRSGVF